MTDLEKTRRRHEAHSEHEEWLSRVRKSGIAEHLTGVALTLIYLTLGNNCWRENVTTTRTES